MLDRRAAVHDDGQTTRRRDPRSLPVDDAELQPETPRTDLDRLAGARHAQLRAAEDVDDVEGPRRLERVAEAAEGRDAEDLMLARVDRDALVALVEEVAEHAE